MTDSTRSWKKKKKHKTRKNHVIIFFSVFTSQHDSISISFIFAFYRYHCFTFNSFVALARFAGLTTTPERTGALFCFSAVQNFYRAFFISLIHVEMLFSFFVRCFFFVRFYFYIVTIVLHRAFDTFSLMHGLHSLCCAKRLFLPSRFVHLP